MRLAGLNEICGWVQALVAKLWSPPQTVSPGFEAQA